VYLIIKKEESNNFLLFLFYGIVFGYTEQLKRKKPYNLISTLSKPSFTYLSLILTQLVSIMKKVLFALAVVTFLLMSCNRGITPYQAANGKAGKCGKNYIR
jgi:hypothetical protein